MSSTGDNNDSKHGLPMSSSQDEGNKIKEELGLSKFLEWNDPMIPQIEELLIKSLSTTYRVAVKKIAERGYSEEIAECAVLRSGPHFGRKEIVSNIVDSALRYLGTEKELDTSRSRMFEDLENLIEYTMLEMTYVLREVKPSLSIADAMWCLLIFDLNLPIACAMEGDPLKFLVDKEVQGESSSGSTLDKQVNSEPQKSDWHLLSSQLLCELQKTEKESGVSVQVTRQRSVQEILMEGAGKKKYAHHSKKDLLRKKTFQFEKSNKGPMSKGVFKTKLTSLGGLTLDKKPKPQSDGGVNLKNSSMSHEANPKTPMRVPQEKAKTTQKTQTNTPSPPKTADYYCAGIPYDESQGKYVAQDDKDEIILALVSRMQVLQKEGESWDDWAHQKVMQATRRLSLDQTELKILRLEKEETEKFINEQQCLEVSTVKRMIEMEHALTSSTEDIMRLEAENSVLKKKAEDANEKGLQEAAKLDQAVLREQEALKKCQSIESEKGLLQDELKALNFKTGSLQQGVDKSKAVINQLEVLRAHEESEKMKILKQAENTRKEKEHIKAVAKVEMERIEEKAKNELQKRKNVMRKMEEMISALKLGGTLKQEDECVMCLSEEKSVLFLPCAHQVLCVDCNVIHEKKGMKDCPSCRTLIQKRVNTRFDR